MEIRIMSLKSGMKLDGWQVETWYRYKRTTSGGEEQLFPSLHRQPSSNKKLISIPVSLMIHPDNPFEAHIITEENVTINRD